MVSPILLPMRSPAMFQLFLKHLSNSRSWPQLSLVTGKYNSCHRPTHHSNLTTRRFLIPIKLFFVTLPREILDLDPRRGIYEKLLSLSQPAISVWPNMKRDIAQWTRACHTCQQFKIHRPVKPPFQFFPAFAAQFDSIHADLVGPLPPSQGYNYLFTCVDRYTRWPEPYQ